ncbi:hypothetical protein FKW77_001508 [Venturia effusa]|uniref:Uncharacterized protein n=1 Tax=Venturia effusa TaxID=50376 RepID=A0A517LI42_9PEZI|nr:hypothetical protein FKW77_001508 [Venturia effusa]
MDLEQENFFRQTMTQALLDMEPDKKDATPTKPATPKPIKKRKSRQGQGRYDSPGNSSPAGSANQSFDVPSPSPVTPTIKRVKTSAATAATEGQPQYLASPQQALQHVSFQPQLSGLNQQAQYQQAGNSQQVSPKQAIAPQANMERPAQQTERGDSRQMPAQQVSDPQPQVPVSNQQARNQHIGESILFLREQIIDSAFILYQHQPNHSPVIKLVSLSGIELISAPLTMPNTNSISSPAPRTRNEPIDLTSDPDHGMEHPTTSYRSRSGSFYAQPQPNLDQQNQPYPTEQASTEVSYLQLSLVVDGNVRLESCHAYTRVGENDIGVLGRCMRDLHARVARQLWLKLGVEQAVRSGIREVGGGNINANGNSNGWTSGVSLSGRRGNVGGGFQEFGAQSGGNVNSTGNANGWAGGVSMSGRARNVGRGGVGEFGAHGGDMGTGVGGVGNMSGGDFRGGNGFAGGANFGAAANANANAGSCEFDFAPYVGGFDGSGGLNEMQWLIRDEQPGEVLRW